MFDSLHPPACPAPDSPSRGTTALSTPCLSQSLAVTLDSSLSFIPVPHPQQVLSFLLQNSLNLHCLPAPPYTTLTHRHLSAGLLLRPRPCRFFPKAHSPFSTQEVARVILFNNNKKAKENHTTASLNTPLWLHLEL